MMKLHPQYKMRGLYNGSKSFNSRVLDKETGRPIPYAEVELYHQTKKIYIETIFCDSAGEFKVVDINLADNVFFVISHDEMGIKRGDMIDNITGNGGSL